MAKQQERAAPQPPTQTHVSSGVQRWVKWFALIVAAGVIYLGVALFAKNEAVAAEPEGDVPVVEEVAEVEEPAPSTSSRFGQAFDLIFKGDARAVIAEANAELEARIAEADMREANLNERQAGIEDGEVKLAELQEEIFAQQELTKRQHEALTNCVLNAMKGGDE